MAGVNNNETKRSQQTSSGRCFDRLLVCNYVSATVFESAELNFCVTNDSENESSVILNILFVICHINPRSIKFSNDLEKS